MPVNSNVDAVSARFDAALGDALFAAALVYRNAMTEALRNAPTGGYTTGDFDHGMAGVAGSVAVSEPASDAAGQFVAVGTNIVYAKFWELGHINLFTRKYERVERWRPTLARESENMAAKFAAVLNARMQG